MLIGILIGLLLYSGIGAAYPEVTAIYLIYYFCFFLSIVLFFPFFNIIFSSTSRISGRALKPLFERIDRQFGWSILIWIYFFLHILPLVYPDFRLYQLISPPTPDLPYALAMRFYPQETNYLLKIASYIQILLTPIFYVALYRYRNRIVPVIMILFGLIYIQYVDKGTIGRSPVFMAMLLIFIAIWVNHPRYRKHVVVVGIALLPVFFVASYMYSIIRIGGQVHDISLADATLNIINSETSFPKNVGMVIIESGEKVDFISYMKWILTLPIPKVLTGEIEGARINYEISDIIFATSRGERGWHVVLPGLISESVYIYGHYFFFFHGIFIAFIAAFIICLIERTPQLLFLKAYVIVLFAYVLNRGGIAALLPTIINQFLLFYLIIFVVVFKPYHHRRVKTKITEL